MTTLKGLAVRTAFLFTAAAPVGGTYGPLRDRLTVVYAMRTKGTEALLKFGIWSNRVGQRYSQLFLDQVNAKFPTAIAWGSREEMLKLERHLTERFGGPLNRERWANSLPPTVFPPSEEAIEILKQAGLWPP